MTSLSPCSHLNNKSMTEVRNICGHTDAPYKAKGLCVRCYSLKRQNDRYRTDEKFREAAKENQRQIRAKRRDDPIWKELRRKYTERHIAKIGIDAWRKKNRRHQALWYTKKRALEVLADLAKLVPAHSHEFDFDGKVIRSHIRPDDEFYSEKVQIYQEVWQQLKPTL